MRRTVCLLSVLTVFVFTFSQALFADDGDAGDADAARIRKRWSLDIKCKAPKFFSYTNALGRIDQYWYSIFEVTNKNETDVYVGVSCFAKTDTNSYYPSVTDPVIERNIIEKEENLGGYPYDVVKEKIDEYKAQNRYFNTYELSWEVKSIIEADGKEKFVTRRRLIKPGQTLMAIALFRNIDEKFQKLELHFDGLVDVLRYRLERNFYLEEPNYDTPDFNYEYESRIFITYYQRKGGTLFIQFSQLDYLKQEWMIQSFGYVADKSTLKNLIDALESEDPLIRTFANGILRTITDVPADDDRWKFNTLEPPDAAPDNKEAILLWKEWWFRKNTMLQYNPAMQRFFVVEAKKEEE